MNTVCPCKGCENRTPYCHADCTEYSRWRDLVDELKRRDKPNVDALEYTVERIYKKKKQTDKLRRKTRYAQ